MGLSDIINSILMYIEYQERVLKTFFVTEQKQNEKLTYLVLFLVFNGITLFTATNIFC